MIGYLLCYRVAQGGLYRHLVPPLRPALLSLPELLRWVPRRPDDGGLRPVAGDGLPRRFFFEASVGTVGFWFLEVTSLLYIVMTLNFFISGHMLPLDLLPPPWATILKALPFQYMAYFHGRRFLGQGQRDGPGLLPAGRTVLGALFPGDGAGALPLRPSPL